MGANLQIFSFPENIKTPEQAKKAFDEMAEQDRIENGSLYSGSIGMLRGLRNVNIVFDSIDDFE